MNEDRRIPSWINPHGRARVGRTGLSWVYIAAVRPWIPLVFDRLIDHCGPDEPKSPRPAHEQYQWMKRIRSDR